MEAPDFIDPAEYGLWAREHPDCVAISGTSENVKTAQVTQTPSTAPLHPEAAASGSALPELHGVVGSTSLCL
jgi:hypothetical protein